MNQGNLQIAPETWLNELFECENCAECGKGANEHTAVPFNGNWFAYCNENSETTYLET